MEMLDTKRAEYFSKVQTVLKAHLIQYELTLKKYENINERRKQGQLQYFEEASEIDSL